MNYNYAECITTGRWPPFFEEMIHFDYYSVWNHLDYSDTEEKTLALCSGFSSAKFQSFDCGQDVWKTTSSMLYEMYS